MATKKRRRRVLRSVDDFYSYCDLSDIVYTDVHVWQPDEFVEPGTASLTATFSMSEDAETLVVNIRVTLSTERWNYQVGVAALYAGKGPFRVEPSIMGDVINQSTVVTAVPFLRSAVLDLAMRVRDTPAPILPLAGPGTGPYLVVKDGS